MQGKIGLALGGGAGLGWAHIGVIRALEDAGIRPDVISGTSIGSIVGAAVAAHKLNELEDLARSITLKDMVSMSEFGFKSGSMIGAGKIEEELRQHFGHSTIDELPIPFAAVAADVMSGQEHVFDTGDVVTALRASSAVPGVLPPVQTARMMLADGGLVNPVPVDVAYDLGAEYVIAVDLQGDYEGKVARMGLTRRSSGRPSMMKVARAGLFLSLHKLGQARMAATPPDILVTPKIGHIEMMDFTKADVLIAEGMRALTEALPQIRAVDQRGS